MSTAERYCGVCGVDLATGLREKSDQYEEHLLKAQQLQLDSRFDEAIALVEPICGAKHGRLSNFAQRAQILVSQLREQRGRAKTKAEESFDEARLLMEELDYEGVVEMLEAVPAPYLTDEMSAVLSTARERANEIDLLTEQLRQAAAGQQVGDLLAKVERLLALRPLDPLARQMAERFRDRVLKAAAARLEKHQYDDALVLLERVPEIAENEAVTELNHRAAELACLSWDLRNAPFADKGLVAVARRFHKLAPKDPHLGPLLERLRQRLNKTAEDTRLGPPKWAAPPERTVLGPPVNWATEFRRIEIGQNADVALLKQHPGRFFVACGLALQGLGKAHIDINLQIDDSDGLLQRAKRMMRKRSAATAWGFDLSSSGLKAVKLSFDAERSGVVIDACDLIEHRKLLSQATSEVEERTLIEETIRKFLSRHEPKADRLCVGLPGMMTLCRQICLPPMDAKRIAEVMQYEVRVHLPIEAGNLAWGYQAIGETDEADALHARDILLVAVRREQLARHVEKLHGLKIEFDVVQSDCVALHNFFHYEYFGDDDRDAKSSSKGNSAIAILDAGTEGTNFIVSSPDGVWFRNIGVGGHSLTKALVCTLNSTFAQAEELKRDLARAPRISQVQDAIDPLVRDFANETLASVSAYKNAGGKKRIGRYIGTGGAFQTHGLLRYLRTGR